MSFTPKVSFVSCIKFGSFTRNKETLLLQTLLLSSIRALSSPNASATSGQILPRPAEAAVGAEFIFAGAQHDDALVALREDRQCRGSLEAGAVPRWVEGRRTTRIRGVRQGPPRRQGRHRHPVALPAGCPLAPGPPHTDPSWLQPSSTAPTSVP